jgi:BirA family transcriptional regulator, biotin operon repressor / biotin---[acetyl-CoA-carboxylase] ligase
VRLPEGPWIELDQVDSTQDEAARRIVRGEMPGVIFSRQQSQGRGRLQRPWWTADGALCMSLVFDAYPNHPKPWLFGMTLACACAGVLHCQIQWPNDLVLHGKKLGGILTELVADPAGDKYAVVGVGINLAGQDFPAEIAARATSLEKEGLTVPAPSKVANAILERAAELPEPTGWQNLLPIWSLFDATPGKQYKLPGGADATAIGIGPAGELLCTVNGEPLSIAAADAIYG